jgi:hypothetical protein
VNGNTPEVVREVGLTLLIMEVRRRLHLGASEADVTQWMDREFEAASRRVDAIERDGGLYEFFCAETP